MRAHNRRFTEEQEANIRKLYMDGMSCTAIAKSLRCPCKTITRVCADIIGQNGRSTADYHQDYYRRRMAGRISRGRFDAPLLDEEA